jgi:hypothetical protein
MISVPIECLGGAFNVYRSLNAFIGEMQRNITER